MPPINRILSQPTQLHPRHFLVKRSAPKSSTPKSQDQNWTKTSLASALCVRLPSRVVPLRATPVPAPNATATETTLLPAAASSWKPFTPVVKMAAKRKSMNTRTSCTICTATLHTGIPTHTAICKEQPAHVRDPDREVVNDLATLKRNPKILLALLRTPPSMTLKSSIMQAEPFHAHLVKTAAAGGPHALAGLLRFVTSVSRSTAEMTRDTLWSTRWCGSKSLWIV